MAYLIIGFALAGILVQWRTGAPRAMRRTSVLILLLSIFLLVLISAAAVYMARLNIYSLRLQQYITFSRRTWGTWAYSGISRDTLIRAVEFFACGIPPLSFGIAVSMTGNWQKRSKSWTAILVLYLLLYLFFDPDLSVLLYRRLYPSMISYMGYLNLMTFVERFAQMLNILVLGVSLVLLVLYVIRLPKLPELWYGKVTMIACEIGLSASFIALFNWLPCRLVRYSQLTGEKTYLSVSLGKEAMINPTSIALQLILILMLSAGLLIDFTQRLRLRRDSRQAAVSRNAIHAISRILMHYIKNELLAIENEVEIAKIRTTPEAKEQALDRILDRCQGIRGRIETARAQSSAYSLMLERVQLRKLIDEVLKKLSDRLVDFRVEIRIPETLSLQLDPHSFSDVIENLLINAVEASGEVPPERKHIILTAEKIQDFVRLRITDHGRGMDRKTKESAFSPYFSDKPTSSNWGLGLTLCQAVLRAHHGSIMLESRVGEGTTFTLILPMSDMEEEE